jgi:hypothetical protein
MVLGRLDRGVAWGLHVGALSLAPLSIVQAVLSGGLVFLAVFAERFFGFRLGRRQWAGVTITAAGLVVIGLTGGGANDPQRASLAALIAVEGAIFAIGAALVRVSTRRHVLPRAEGLLLGAAAGALFGVSDVAIKWLTQAAPGPLLGLLSPWTLTAMIAGVIAFYASARSLQIGEGVEVIALTSVAANLAAIIGGILVFHEPIGSGPLEIGARFLAFCLSSPARRSCPPRCAPPPTRPARPDRRPARATRHDARRPVARFARERRASHEAVFASCAGAITIGPALAYGIEIDESSRLTESLNAPIRAQEARDHATRSDRRDRQPF